MPVAGVSSVNRIQGTQATDRSAQLQTRAFSTNPLLRKIAAGGTDDSGAPLAIAKRARPPIPSNPPRPTDAAAAAAYDAIDSAANAGDFKKAVDKVSAAPAEQRGVLLQKLGYEVGHMIDRAKAPAQLKDAQATVDVLPPELKATWQPFMTDRPKQIEAEKATEIVQTYLFSRGKDLLPNGPYLPRDQLDGRLGPKSEVALKAIQEKLGVPITGKVDADTVRAMDKDAKAQIDQLKQQPRSQAAAKVVVDMVDKQNTRMVLLDKQGQVLARYDVSPGKDPYPTVGDVLKTSDAMVRTPWNNGGSAWSKNMPAQLPPGVNNPMGLLKFPIDGKGQYIHDIPGGEERELGRVASHGCIRMGTGIYEAREKYGLRGGLPVVLARDAATRDRELAAANASGAPPRDRPHDAGREYLFGYLSGELGGPSPKQTPARRPAA